MFQVIRRKIFPPWGWERVGEIGARRELFLVMGVMPRHARLLGSCNIPRLRVNYGALGGRVTLHRSL